MGGLTAAGDMTAVAEDFLTIREVAQTLRFTERTVYSMVRADEIHAFKVRSQWRVRRESLEGYLERTSELPAR